MKKLLKNPLRKKPVDGSTMIHGAVGKFSAIAAEIEAGISANHATINAHKQTVAVLEDQITDLSVDATYGSRVAAKLRELIA